MLQIVGVRESNHFASSSRGEIDNPARIEELDHVQIRIEAPPIDLDAKLGRLPHPAHEHRLEMLALGHEQRLVPVQLLVFNHEDDVRECRIVDQSPHVADQIGDGLIGDPTGLYAADVQQEHIIQPLVAVEASKQVQVLVAHWAGRVSLSASRGAIGL